MNAPSVSIGMPVYNGENYVRKAIESILAQTHEDYEFIISDNASADGTMEICRSYADRDRRIRFSRNEKNMGGAWNFNQVFRLARGRYFQWACHDDVWAPTLLERCVEVLENHPEVALCYTRTLFVDENGLPMRSIIGRPNLGDRDPCRRFRRFLEYHSNPNECNPVLGLFRARMLRRTPLIGTYPASDMILLGEIALHGRFHEIPECLFFRRDHPLTSVRANPGWEDRAAWFDPGQRGKIQTPRWRWFLEWNRAILRSPIGMPDKLKCASDVCRWARRNRQNLEKELKYRIKRIISIHA
ncbi:MAG: glycosyltransferase [Deltaproteobacteria bacterium]|nr:glycosyltransferase [Deltaproteobacteria bacterium]PWB62053.1 MAG: glycosyltransferase family 2 protein [Deltaproteobacteria bacterium]